MPYITIVEQSYLVQKIQECGMRWEAAIKKWEKQMRLSAVIHVLKIVRIEKESLFIKWESSTTQWVLNTSRKQ
jgi:hypothetical protein